MMADCGSGLQSVSLFVGKIRKGFQQIADLLIVEGQTDFFQ